MQSVLVEGNAMPVLIVTIGFALYVSRRLPHHNSALEIQVRWARLESCYAVLLRNSEEWRAFDRLFLLRGI